MILPIKTFKQFVKTNESPQEIAETFYNLGFPSEQITDEYLDIEITPNRGDCASVLGLSREYGAAKNLKPQPIDLTEINFADKSMFVKFDFTRAELSPRYAGLIIKNIKNIQSPEWMQKILKIYNIKPQNLLVDLTNYLTFELGMPLHVFDLDKIREREFILRTTKAGETIKVLTGQEFSLPEGAIVFENNNRLIDLCGIVGGESSKVNENTKTILLQAAIFSKDSIAKTIRTIRFSTEASYRFERAVDYNLPLLTLSRAAKIIKDSSDFQIAESFDIQNIKLKEQIIQLDYRTVEKLLGTRITKQNINGILQRLGFTEKEEQWQVPSWRVNDINFPADLVEEVVRLYGYNRLNKKEIVKTNYQPQVIKTNYEELEKIKNYLKSLGFCEVQTSSFISGGEVKLTEQKLIEVANPVSAEYQYLRPSLLIKLVKSAAANPWWSEVSLFELGQVFPGEEKTAVGIIATRQLPPALKEKFPSEIKIIEQTSQIAKFYKLRRKAWYLEAAPELFEPLKTTKVAAKPLKYQPVSKFPPVVFDLAAVFAANINCDELVASIKELSTQILIAEIFDVYHGIQIPEGKISIALRIVCQDLKKSLTQIEANALRDKIIKLLETKFDAKLR